MIPVVSFIGNFRSGKTPVLEEVVPERMAFIERLGMELFYIERVVPGVPSSRNIERTKLDKRRPGE